MYKRSQNFEFGSTLAQLFKYLSCIIVNETVFTEKLHKNRSKFWNFEFCCNFKAPLWIFHKLKFSDTLFFLEYLAYISGSIIFRYVTSIIKVITPQKYKVRQNFNKFTEFCLSSQFWNSHISGTNWAKDLKFSGF